MQGIVSGWSDRKRRKKLPIKPHPFTYGPMKLLIVFWLRDHIVPRKLKYARCVVEGNTVRNDESPNSSYEKRVLTMHWHLRQDWVLQQSSVILRQRHNRHRKPM